MTTFTYGVLLTTELYDAVTDTYVDNGFETATFSLVVPDGDTGFMFTDVVGSDSDTVGEVNVIPDALNIRMNGDNIEPDFTWAFRTFWTHNGEDYSTDWLEIYVPNTFGGPEISDIYLILGGDPIPELITAEDRDAFENLITNITPIPDGPFVSGQTRTKRYPAGLVTMTSLAVVERTRSMAAMVMIGCMSTTDKTAFNCSVVWAKTAFLYPGTIIPVCSAAAIPTSCLLKTI
jgi:hypothetical protein